VNDQKTLLQTALKRTKERFSNISPEVRSSLPKLRRPGKWRSWGLPGIVGVFYQTKEGERLSKKFEKQGLGPYPGLLSTNPEAPVAIDMSGALNFFASNRIEGRGFRVQPTASFTLWQHAQVFSGRSGRHFVYIVPLAFILGTKPNETELELQERLDQLVDHTFQVWCDLDVGA